MNGFFSGCFCLFIVSNLKLSGKLLFFGKIRENNNLRRILELGGELCYNRIEIEAR